MIDPEHVTVAFLVEHIGYARVLGFFGDVEGSYVFDEETGALTAAEVSVATASVSSNHDERDEHLRSRDFLDTDRHAVMRFSNVTAERLDEHRFALTGQLELLGATRPLQLEATWNKSADYPIGRNVHVMGVSARGTLSRSAYGMTYGVDNGWVGDDVEILIEFEARRQ